MSPRTSSDDAAAVDGGTGHFTPGPWSWVRYLGLDEFPEHYVALGHPLSSVADTSVIETDYDQHGCIRLVIENPADAALIAASPLLLAALERALSGLVAWREEKEREHPWSVDGWLIEEEVRAALSAARPQASEAGDGGAG